jgi:hypothetical protein
LTDQQAKWISRAHRESRPGWIFLQIEGGAEERGFQHGYLMSREIAEEIRIRRAVWKHGTAREWSWLVEKAEPCPRQDEAYPAVI